ncbi:CRAL-TRIO domain-containing protein [Obelidium mucronatum]|nr:CRAL-TRIO domain-containing protein [Obelidium mucronatum]
MRYTIANENRSSAIPALTAPDRLKPNVPENYPFNELTEAQTILVQEFRNIHLGAVKASLTGVPCADETEFISDECLVRYLRATKWKLDESVVRLQDTLQWRREYRPTEINEEDMKAICAVGGQYLNGFDKQGRPIMVNVARLGSSVKNYEHSVKFSIYLMERAIQSMPKGVSQVCVLTEYSGATMFNGYPITVTMKYMDILSKHYPERLAVTCVVNPSWAIPMLYKLVKPFMDPVTLSKIHFAATDGRKDGNSEHGTGGWLRLLDIADADQLPLEFGGEFDFTFDVNEYWKHFMPTKRIA